MPVLFTNNASGTLAASITAAATSITLTTGQGSLFPGLTGSNYFYATLVNSSNNIEIIKVTARSSDVLTVVRGQEGTTALAFAASDKLELRLTAAGLNNLAQLDATQTFSGVNTFTGNTSFSGTNTFSGTITSSTGTFSGTWAGNPTFTGNVTFSNTIAGSVNGNAATVTNGVYTTGTQSIGGVKTFTGSGTDAYMYLTATNGISVFQLTASGTNASFTIYGNATNGERSRISVTDTRSFTVSNNSGSTNHLTLDSSGNLTVTGNMTASSDERLKQNWRTLDSLFLNDLASVKVGIYERKDSGVTQVGVSAQSLKEVLPQAVLEGTDGMLSVAYGNAALAAAVLLAQEVTALKQKVQALEAN